MTSGNRVAGTTPTVDVIDNPTHYWSFADDVATKKLIDSKTSDRLCSDERDVCEYVVDHNTGSCRAPTAKHEGQRRVERGVLMSGTAPTVDVASLTSSVSELNRKNASEVLRCVCVKNVFKMLFYVIIRHVFGVSVFKFLYVCVVKSMQRKVCCSSRWQIALSLFFIVCRPTM